MAQEFRAYPLVVALMKRSRLPWYWVTALVTAGLLLLLTLAVSLDGAIADMLGWEFWFNYLDGLLLVAYVVMISSFMWRLRIRAIQAFRPLLAVDNDAFDRLAAKASAPNRRWEWVFVPTI